MTKKPRWSDNTAGIESSGDGNSRTAVGELIRTLYETTAVVKARAEAFAGPGQSLARWQLLYLLDEGLQTVPELARRLGLSRQAVQRVANLLVDEGLLDIRPNPAHKTSSKYELADAGRSILIKMNNDAKPWHVVVMRSLDEQERETLSRLLEQLADCARNFVSESG